VTKHVTKDYMTNHVTKDETTTEEWAVYAGALTFKGRVHVPDSDELHPKVIALHHNKPELKQPDM
jgi:hypothetical protein